MTAEKVLAFFIALILAAGKLRLEMQMRKDRENGLAIASGEYRYGRIMWRHIRDRKERFRRAGNGEN